MNKVIIIILVLVLSLFIIFFPHQSTEPLVQSLDFGSDDAELLMKFSAAEAPNGSVETKALVMLVVLNRAFHPSFPYSIEEVIEEGHFQSVEDGTYYAAIPTIQDEQALELVYSGWNESHNALYLPKLY